ncbi:MAG: hypothetical protein GWN00_08630 [Aliifodinibius sp.]|nr:hypothetical protein [Fodinibius sp.]NIY24867.1 hypothetical protein [Fodinibius sp.]
MVDKHIQPDFKRTKILDFEDYAPDLPADGIFDEPTRCYKINHRWATIVMGHVSWLCEPDLWANANDERYLAIQEISKFLEGVTCTVDCEQVNDCIETNETINVVLNVSFQQMVDTTSQHLDNLESQYDGTPQSINVNIPNGVPDPQEQNALCYALEKFVKLYAVYKLNELQRKNGLQQFLNEVQSASVNFYNGFTNLVGFDFGANIFSCFVSDNDAITALQDNQAIIDVACCLKSQLENVTISETTWNNAIAACLGTLTANAHDILCLIDNENGQRMYVSFLESYGVALERQAAGEILECNCDPQYAYILWDFTQGLQGWTLERGTVTSQGIRGEKVNPPSNEHWIASVTLQDVTAYDIHRVRYTTEHVGGIANGSTDVDEFIRYNETLDVDGGHIISQSFVSNGLKEWCAGTTHNPKAFRARARGTNTDDQNSYVLIKKIEFWVNLPDSRGVNVSADTLPC